ncbi:hypothetical protein [Streptomyces sp. NPDC002611]
MTDAPQWPNTQPAREQLHKALRLLDNPTDDNLREARRICTQLAEDIPLITAAQYCSEFRRNANWDVCSDRSCGRCGPIRLQLGD